MTLSESHQKQLVRDILNSHYGDGAATQSEYEQLYRTTNAIMNSGTQDGLAGTIKAINGYSETGMNLDGYSDHLNQNKDNLSTWIQDLQ